MTDAATNWLLTQGWSGFVVLMAVGAVIALWFRMEAKEKAAQLLIDAANARADAIQAAAQVRIDTANARTDTEKERRQADAVARGDAMEAMARGSNATIDKLASALKEG